LPAPRFVWMYTLRGIAIILVISHHSSQILLDSAGNAPALMMAVDGFISPFRMPMLMFVSGMLLSRSLAKPTADYFTGKLAGIGWPYLLWSVVVLSLQWQLDVQNLLAVLVLPQTVYWYLWFLLAYYAIAYVLKHVSRPLVIGVAVVLAIVMPPDFRIHRFFLLFAFFIAGDWFMAHRTRWMAALQPRWFLAVCLPVAVATGWATADERIARYSVTTIPGAVAAICLAVALLPKADHSRVLAPVRYVGAHSLVYYMVHWPVMVACAAVVFNVMDGYVAVGVLIVTSMVLATGFAAAADRWPPVDALFRWPRRRSGKSLRS